MGHDTVAMDLDPMMVDGASANLGGRSRTCRRFVVLGDATAADLLRSASHRRPVLDPPDDSHGSRAVGPARSGAGECG